MKLIARIRRFRKAFLIHERMYAALLEHRVKMQAARKFKAPDEVKLRLVRQGDRLRQLSSRLLGMPFEPTPGAGSGDANES
jgi:hypothetical protein